MIFSLFLSCSSSLMCALYSGIEPPDSGREKEGIAALQALESKVDHSVSTTHEHITTFFSIAPLLPCGFMALYKCNFNSILCFPLMDAF